jgi:hypothetical protein
MDRKMYGKKMPASRSTELVNIACWRLGQIITDGLEVINRLRWRDSEQNKTFRNYSQTNQQFKIPETETT